MACWLDLACRDFLSGPPGYWRAAEVGTLGDIGHVHWQWVWLTTTEPHTSVALAQTLHCSYHCCWTLLPPHPASLPLLDPSPLPPPNPAWLLPPWNPMVAMAAALLPWVGSSPQAVPWSRSGWGPQVSLTPVALGNVHRQLCQWTCSELCFILTYSNVCPYCYLHPYCGSNMARVVVFLK